jgi:colanic acid/amylovoran biosynthesis glycosyltransferase
MNYFVDPAQMERREPAMTRQPAQVSRELIVLPSLKAARGPHGGLVLTQKFIDGVASYARSWPGPVTTLVQLTDTLGSDMDHVEILPETPAPAFEVRPARLEDLAQRIRGAALVSGFLSPFELETVQLCHRLGVPMVFTSEYTLRTEKQILDAEVSNPLVRWRRKLWVTQAEAKRRRALALSAGLQCSGAPTYEVYRHLHPNVMIFFDNRVPRRDVIDEAELEAKLSALREGLPLRLVFGGRLIPMKGVQDLPRFAQALKRRGVPFTLDIYGRGALEGTLACEIERRGLSQEVRLKGVVDFRQAWVPLLKQTTDLFVCCHPQGDPSSTYPEVMSCGVPIAGYDNEAFKGIVQHSGSGWLSPTGDVEHLAQEVARLAAAREELAMAARCARKFALAHAFEDTFAARVRHMVGASRLPRELKAAWTPATPEGWA